MGRPKTKRSMPLEFKSKLERPTEPKIEDYGLTQQDLTDRYLRWFDKFTYDKLIEDKLYNIIWGILFFSSSILIIIYWYKENVSPWIFISIPILFGLFILTSLTSLIIIALIKLFIVLSVTSTEKQKIKNRAMKIKIFETDFNSHKQILSKYDLAVAKEKEAFELSQKNYWLHLGGLAFEHEVAELLRKDGYIVEVTPGSGDGGIDLILSKSGSKVVVQCKNHSQRVSINDIRAFYGVLHKKGYQKGIMIGSSGFYASSNEFSDKIEFWDVSHLIQIVHRTILNENSATNIQKKEFNYEDKPVRKAFLPGDSIEFDL